jgi:toxin CptA
MHSAPAVTYPAGASSFERGLRLALPGLAVVLLAVWAWVLAGALPAAWWLALVAALALLGWNHWAARHPRHGQLSWEPVHEPHADGSPPGHWRWTSPAWRRGTPVVLIDWAWDLQSVVLLRLHNPDGLRWWVWLERAQAPAEWEALRRALKAHAPAG